MSDGYYLQDLRKSRDVLFFWRTGDHGYTTKIEEARIFSSSEILAKIKDDYSGKFRAWPVGVILATQSMMVCDIDLPVDDERDNVTLTHENTKGQRSVSDVLSEALKNGK